MIYFLERKMIHFINEKWIFLKNILCSVYILNKKIIITKAKNKFETIKRQSQDNAQQLQDLCHVAK